MTKAQIEVCEKALTILNDATFKDLSAVKMVLNTRTLDMFARMIQDEKKKISEPLKVKENPIVKPKGKKKGK